MLFFWEQITESQAFCLPACSDRCRGTDEDELDDDSRVGLFTDVDEEITRIVYHIEDARITSEKRRILSENNGRVYDRVPCLTDPHAKFSLPWADLDGKKKNSLVTSGLLQMNGSTSHSSTKSSSTAQSILPFSTGSTGTSFDNLYRPIFVTGIPTKAYQYKADSTDPIDVEVHHALHALNPEALQLVALRRVEAGRYEIEGRTVSVYRGSSGGLLVHENEVLGADIGDLPLQAYINLVANVAQDIQRLASTETFYSAGAARLNDLSVDGDERYEAMQVACMQAKIRERG